MSSLTVLAASGLFNTQAEAQALGATGEPIDTGEYAIDLAPSAIVGGGRVMGLSGAYVALAERTAGNALNPAAPAVRTANSLSHFDWDASIGVTFPATLRRNDFFNTGKSTSSNVESADGNYVFFDVAGNIQLGPWGAGVAIGGQNYELSGLGASGTTLSATLGFVTAQLARSFFGGAVVLGGGWRQVALLVENSNAPETDESTPGETQRFNTTGTGWEGGVLFRPNDSQFRLGLAVKSSIRSSVAENNLMEAAIVLPEAVAVPWEVSGGLALQFGRVLNPRWINPGDQLESVRRQLDDSRRAREVERATLHAQAEQRGGDVEGAKAAIDAQLDQQQALDHAYLQQKQAKLRTLLQRRYQAQRRRYVLVTSQFGITGKTRDGVGVESFLQQVVNRSGEDVTTSLRLGVETEVIPRWLTFRSGVYREPTRFRSNPTGARYHLTFGNDVQLLKWDAFGIAPEDFIWRLRAAVDFAPRYFGWALGLGGFY